MTKSGNHHSLLRFSIFLFSILFFLSASSPVNAACRNRYADETACPENMFACYDSQGVLTDCCDTAEDYQGCLEGLPVPTDRVGDITSIYCSDVGTIRTALGCIRASDPQALITQLVRWAIGIAAGAAIFTIAYSGFLITTAGGDVKKVNEGKNWLVTSLLGLLLISIAMLLLNFIGVRILGLQDFGFGV